MPIYCTGYHYSLSSLFSTSFGSSPTPGISNFFHPQRMVQVGRDHLSKLPANAGSLAARYSGFSTDSYRHLQGKRLYNLFGQLFQCSVAFTVKMFSLMFRRNYLRSSFCPLTLVLLLGTTKTPGSIL